MKLLQGIWKEIIHRSLGTSPLEVALFFFFILLFIAVLVVGNRRRREKELQLLLEAWEAKWDHYTRKYEISAEEEELLNRLAKSLKTPEKRYILLVDNHLFNACLQRYLRLGRGDEELARGVMLKAGLKPVSEEMKGIIFQRRRTKRIKVDIPCEISSVEPETRNFTGRIIDLSSRGAAVENPEGHFQLHSDIRIGFSFRQKQYKNVPAEVVRVSGGGSILHLSFEHMA
jgi:PilZ domain